MKSGHSVEMIDDIACFIEGVHPEYDQALADIKKLNRELDEYLEKQRTRLANRVSAR